MKVKICGVCRPADARLATDAGAAFVGVILSPGFRRSCSAEDAERIYAELPASVARVGVFAGDEPHRIRHLAERFRLDVIQLHGDETPDDAAALRDAGAHVWKSVAPRMQGDVAEAVLRFGGSVDALLLDGGGGGGGGGGTPFDWAGFAAERHAIPNTLPVVLAGGLDPENVARAIDVLRPDIVDVSSGVESELRAKDPDRVRRFIEAAMSSARRKAG